MCPSNIYIFIKKELYLGVRLEETSTFMYKTCHFLFSRKPGLGCELVQLPQVLHYILQYLGIDRAFYYIKEHLGSPNK